MFVFRERIDAGFGAWARGIARHPVAWLCVPLLVAGLLGSRLPELRIETSTEDYLLDSDPAKLAYDAFREQFGRDQPLFVLVEPPEVFDLGFLRDLEALHRDLEGSVPHLDEVLSLVNIRSVYGRGDELVVDDLLEVMPGNEAELAELRARVMATPSYLDSVISRDGEVAVLIVQANAYSEPPTPDDPLSGFEPDPDAVRPPFLTGRDNFEFCQAVLDVVEAHRGDDLRIHLTGQPLVAFALTKKMAQDVPRIFGGALLLIGGLIVALFRRFTPVLLTSVVVVLSLVSTLGVSELLDIPIGLPTQILPSFVLAVGVGYAVHLMAAFYRELEREMMRRRPEAEGDADGRRDPDRSTRGAALEAALRHVGLPVLMTGVTTAAGLLSFVVADMEQVLQFGIVGSIGVLLTLVYSLSFLAAALVLLPARSRSAPRLVGPNALLTACARISIHHPRRVVAATAALALAALALVPALDYSADPIRYFEPGHWLREATMFADERLGGMQSLEVVVDTGRPGGLHEPAVLDGMNRLDARVHALAAEGEKLGSTISVVDIVKEIHQALNENRVAYYAVPRSRELVAQELLLFENSGSDDLEELVDPAFSKARISIRTGWEDGVEKARMLRRVLDPLFAALGDVGDVGATGAVVLIARTAEATASTLIRSYSLALVLITPLMVLLIGNLRAGLVSMVPNLVPILATLGLMVLLDIELDIFTILGACIAIGLAVDDSIHFITGFRRRLAETGDPARAVELTMETTGRALLFTSSALVAGFVALGLSSMANLAHLGLLTAFAIGLAFVLDVTVTPALLILTHEKR